MRTNLENKRELSVFKPIYKFDTPFGNPKKRQQMQGRLLST
jgi:hypothetical protein